MEIYTMETFINDKQQLADISLDIFRVSILGRFIKPFKRGINIQTSYGYYIPIDGGLLDEMVKYRNRYEIAMNRIKRIMEYPITKEEAYQYIKLLND